MYSTASPAYIATRRGLRELCNVTGAHTANVWVLSNDGETLLSLVGVGPTAEPLGRVVIPRRGSLAGAALFDPARRLVPNVQEDPLHLGGIRHVTGLDTVALLSQPLTHGGHEFVIQAATLMPVPSNDEELERGPPTDDWGGELTVPRHIERLIRDALEFPVYTRLLECEGEMMRRFLPDQVSKWYEEEGYRLDHDRTLFDQLVLYVDIAHSGEFQKVLPTELFIRLIHDFHSELAKSLRGLGFRIAQIQGDGALALKTRPHSTIDEDLNALATALLDLESLFLARNLPLPFRVYATLGFDQTVEAIFVPEDSNRTVVFIAPALYRVAGWKPPKLLRGPIVYLDSSLQERTSRGFLGLDLNSFLSNDEKGLFETIE